jgi:rod shape-determining protein MreD
MAVTPAGRVQGVLPKIVPVVVTVTLALLSVVPIAIPDYAAVTPDFVLMSVYHWTLYRPGFLPYIAVFAIGMFFDLISAAPLGLGALVLLLLRWTVLNRRRYFIGRSFAFIWGGFTIAAAAAGSLRWAVGSTLAAQFLDPRGFVFQTVLTVACYPIMTLLFARLQRATMS